MGSALSPARVDQASFLILGKFSARHNFDYPGLFPNQQESVFKIALGCEVIAKNRVAGFDGVLESRHPLGGVEDLCAAELHRACDFDRDKILRPIDLHALSQHAD